jgi:cation transport regulator
MVRNISSYELWQQIKNLRGNIKVKTEFSDQVKQIDALYSNDKTGLVSTIVDFMIHSATVNLKIETKNETLNLALQKWQKTILNHNVNIDIPGGLRALSKENYQERWRSSLLALKVIWGKEKFGNQVFEVPKKMWFLDGASITTESSGALNTRKYFITINKKSVPLKNTTKESIFIRKPYTPWHKDKVVPYLVQRGTVFNTLIKNAIVQKQSDVIEAIIPLLLKIQAGNDELALEGMNPGEKEFKKLKDQIVDAIDRFKDNGNFGDLIASLRHDVKLEYLIPDLIKIFDEKIIKSTDRNLLSSLGMIELKGFSSTREEAILNPKVLIEEVTDAVLDWANLLQDVMIEMMERNKSSHPNLTNNTIQVIPGTIKAFLTEEMKTLLRSMFDRGLVSHQNATEDIAGMNFEVQVERNIREDKDNITKIMKPPVIQNLERWEDPELVDDNNLEDQNKKPGTPEADNFNNAILKYYAKHKKSKIIKSSKPGIINTLEELPDNIKQLSEPEQIVYWLNYNYSIEYDNKTPEEAETLAKNSINLSLTAQETKVDITENFIRIRQRDPDDFQKDSFRTITLSKKEGIKAIIGRLKGETKTTIQSYLFDKEKWTVPEAKNWIKEHALLKGIQEEIMAPYNNINELPDNVKNVLPVPAQLIWLKVFNSVFEETGDEERAIRSAWSQVSKTYEKVEDKKKWVKKANIQDYAEKMSDYVYKLFVSIYNNAIDQSSSNNQAINMALATIEKVCIKNKNGIWVKDKTITKNEIQALNNSVLAEEILNLELKEKKKKLLEKLLDEDK